MKSSEAATLVKRPYASKDSSFVPLKWQQEHL